MDNVSDLNQEVTQPNIVDMTGKKFCKHCGKVIDSEAVLCINCGKQVEELKSSSHAQPSIVINNENNNANTNHNVNNNGSGRVGKEKNKWVSFLLCFFVGWLGVHRFYEGKVLTGILWLFTFGFFGFGVLIDLLILLFKPNPYYV